MLAPCSAKLRATSSSSRGAVERVDRDLDAEAARRRAGFPLDRREPLRIPHQRLRVRAVLAVDRDPAAERDVAEDRVARHRRAALRQPDEDVVDPLHLDPEALAGDGRAGPRRLQRDDRLLGDLLGLQPLEHLVHDLGRLELARAERDVEVLRLAEAGLADHLSQHRRSLQLPVRQALRLQRVSRISRPLASVSPRVSRWNHWRILLRAREDAARLIQSREGPRPDFEVRISTKSPFFSR